MAEGWCSTARPEAECGQGATVEDIMPEPLLQTRGLCFDVNGKRLIDRIDTEIRQGRCTVIMGANGSGKSLLLRLLHGLIPPTTGEILWQGRPLGRRSRKAQAMVFQRPVMLRRSVLANVRFALTVRGIAGRERAVREMEAIDQARLGEVANRPARVLSAGEQQRLAVARALACTPSMLFLDEPTASLDPASVHAVEHLLRKARASNVTIVLTTHDVGQARRLGDDLVFLHAGRIVETGPAEQVLHEPRSEAARAWLNGRLFLDSAS